MRCASVKGHPFGGEAIDVGSFDFAERIQGIHIAVSQIVSQNVNDIEAGTDIYGAPGARGLVAWLRQPGKTSVRLRSKKEG